MSITVIPSPNKFFDYLAAGLPVLTNFKGWIANLVDGSGAGLSCASGSPEELAKVIGVFAEKTHDQKAVMRRSSRVLAEQFTRSDIVSKQCAICEAVAI